MFIWKKLSLMDAAKLRKTLVDKSVSLVMILLLFFSMLSPLCVICGIMLYLNDLQTIKTPADFVAEDTDCSSSLPMGNANYAESPVTDVSLMIMFAIFVIGIRKV